MEKLKVYYYKDDVGGPYETEYRIALIAATSLENAWEVINNGTSWNFIPDFKPSMDEYVMPFYKTEEAAKKAYDKAVRKWEKNKDKWVQEYLDSKQQRLSSYKEVEGIYADGYPRIIMDDDPIVDW